MIRLIVIALILALAYWFWNGPYQDMTTESYQEHLQKNAQLIRHCLSAKDYRAGATGEPMGTAAEQQAQCAQKHKLYQYKGQWYDLGGKRPRD